MPTKPAQDATGKAAARLKKEAADAEKARVEAEAQARAAAVADLDVIEDLTIEQVLEIEPEFEDYATPNVTTVGNLFPTANVEELEEDEPDVVTGARIIRTNIDIDNTVIGQGNYYTFVAGKKYRVPQHVAEHLEGVGALWH